MKCRPNDTIKGNVILDMKPNQSNDFRIEWMFISFFMIDFKKVIKQEIYERRKAVIGIVKTYIGDTFDHK